MPKIDTYEYRLIPLEALSRHEGVAYISNFYDAWLGPDGTRFYCEPLARIDDNVGYLLKAYATDEEGHYDPNTAPYYRKLVFTGMHVYARCDTFLSFVKEELLPACEQFEVDYYEATKDGVATTKGSYHEGVIL